MGTEAVIPFLGLPFLGCVALLVYLSVKRGSDAAGVEHPLGLGRARIAAGYLGALFSGLLVALWMMWSQLRWGLETGNYGRESASSYAAELFFFYFITVGVAVIALLTVIGLPMLALLRRLHFLSVTGIAATGALLAGLFTWWLGTPILYTGVVCIAIAVGFALAARLPAFRGGGRAV